MRTTVPTLVSGDQYSVQYVYARDSTNIRNIDIASSISVRLNQVGSAIGGLVLPQTAKSGTVRVHGNQVFRDEHRIHLRVPSRRIHTDPQREHQIAAMETPTRA